MGKIPINYCSYRDLVTIAGVCDSLANTIIDLRRAQGDLTPDQLMTIPGIRGMPGILQVFDFRPYLPFSEGGQVGGRTPFKSKPEKTQHVPFSTYRRASSASSFPDTWSLPQGDGLKSERPISSLSEGPYPFDEYPPSFEGAFSPPPRAQETRTPYGGVHSTHVGRDDNTTWSSKPAFTKWRDDTSTPKHPDKSQELLNYSKNGQTQNVCIGEN